jgi:hypothetical protein
MSSLTAHPPSPAAGRPNGPGITGWSGLVESGLVESGLVESSLVESSLVESGLAGVRLRGRCPTRSPSGSAGSRTPCRPTTPSGPTQRPGNVSMVGWRHRGNAGPVRARRPGNAKLAGAIRPGSVEWPPHHGRGAARAGRRAGARARALAGGWPPATAAAGSSVASGISVAGCGRQAGGKGAAACRSPAGRGVVGRGPAGARTVGRSGRAGSPRC